MVRPVRLRIAGGLLAFCLFAGQTVEPLRRLAEVHALEGRYLLALSLAKRVMTLDPGLRVHVLIRLSDWSQMLQQPGDAADYLRSAAEICRLEGRAGEASALEARLASMKTVA